MVVFVGEIMEVNILDLDKEIIEILVPMVDMAVEVNKVMEEAFIIKILVNVDNDEVR